jgi:hypothetical protein
MHEEQEDIALAKKFGCPPLNLSFIEAQRRRLCFRNEKALYNRKCDATGENIISIYSTDKPFKVYKSDYWYGDNWDPLEYGQEFDFSRPFFEQFEELNLKVPRVALSNVNNTNSDYCNMTAYNKNCYLIFGGDLNEDCMYGTLGMRNNSCLDTDFSNENELCYEVSDIINCYNCHFAFNSNNCSNCYFINDCIGCFECILCTNLVKKSYCIENTQYSKEEYFSKKHELINGKTSNYKKAFEKFKKMNSNRTVKYSHTINCTDCTGDYLKNSKNCKNSFDTSDSEDCKNIVFSSKCKDCFECSSLGDDSELCFNLQSTFKAYQSKLGYFIIESSDIEYSKYILNCKNIFGCIGLKHKQNCILNKQYSSEEFKKLREKIVDHMKKTEEWGQFFPSRLSDFGYNETTAHAYFPLTKEEALQKGFLWKDEEEKTPITQTINVSDAIEDVDESITKEILQCENCQKNYKILIQEFHFYKKNEIPIPTFCPKCRDERRKKLRNPRQLWDRKCSKCNIELKSSYSPDRPETILCEKCYLKEVY